MEAWIWTVIVVLVIVIIYYMYNKSKGKLALCNQDSDCTTAPNLLCGVFNSSAPATITDKNGITYSGLCGAACSATTPCATGKYCQLRSSSTAGVQNGVCAPSAICGKDSDCGAGYSCQSNTCLPAPVTPSVKPQPMNLIECVSQSDCPSPLVCIGAVRGSGGGVQTVGSCQYSPQCMLSKDCPSPFVCVGAIPSSGDLGVPIKGSCSPQCMEKTDCPSPLVCVGAIPSSGDLGVPTMGSCQYSAPSNYLPFTIPCQDTKSCPDQMECTSGTCTPVQ